MISAGLPILSTGEKRLANAGDVRALAPDGTELPHGTDDEKGGDEQWREIAERLNKMDPEAARRLIREARERLRRDNAEPPTERPN